MTAETGRPHFDESEAYEQFMGAWSRAACAKFLRWLRAPPDACWLDVGCGTGILTQSIVASESPRSIDAIDPSAGQLDFAAQRVRSPIVRLCAASAASLPFADGYHDVVASALVLNFLPDRQRGVREMKRVVRHGGVIAGFVWDFAAERSPSGPLRRQLHAMNVRVPPARGAVLTPESMRTLFEHEGLHLIGSTTLDVEVEFASFEDFWSTQTTRYSPTTAIIDAMRPVQRDTMKHALKMQLCGHGGPLRYPASAHAIKAIAPGAVAVPVDRRSSIQGV